MMGPPLTDNSSTSKGKGKETTTEETEQHQKATGFMLYKAYPALTETEIIHFRDKNPEAIVVTTAEFRYDFSKAVNDPFNANALYVATRGFQAALRSGWYLQDDPNYHYEDIFYATGTIELHMKLYFRYLASQWSEASDPEYVTAYNARLDASLQHGRRKTVKCQPCCLALC